MSGETFRKLNLDSKNLDTNSTTVHKLPTLVGANGTSLGAIGKINCEIEIGKKRFKQTFLVCENLTRSLILGVDFANQNAAGLYWTKHNSFVLTIDGETVAETKELHNKAAISLKKRTNTIAQLKTQSNLYEVNSSRHYKCKGLVTEEFQSISELQNHQIPKVKTGLANHWNNNWRYLSDSRESSTTSPTQ